MTVSIQALRAEARATEPEEFWFAEVSVPSDTLLALLDVAQCAYVFLNAENNDPRIEGYFKALGEALQKVEL